MGCAEGERERVASGESSTKWCVPALLVVSRGTGWWSASVLGGGGSGQLGEGEGQRFEGERKRENEYETRDLGFGFFSW